MRTRKAWNIFVENDRETRLLYVKRVKRAKSNSRGKANGPFASRIIERVRESLKKRFCQNTGYTGEDSVGIEMRRWRGKGQKREKVRGRGDGDGSRYISRAMRYGFS